MPRLRTAAVIVTIALIAVAPRSFAGMNRWTTSGPEGAVITSLLQDPADPRIVYAGTPGGGLFRSTSDGEPRWETIGADPLEGEITALAADPAAPATLYAGTSGGRVFVSRDRGAQFTEVSNPGSGPVVKLAIDSQRRAIYIATAKGLLVSRDDGRSWRAAPQIAGDTRSVVISASGAVYASVGGAIYVSLDGGTSWTRTTMVTSANVLAADPQSSTVYATAGVGVWASSDNGKTWRLLPLLDIAASELLAVGNRVYAATPLGLYEYEQGGTAWKRVGTLAQRITALTVASSSPRTIYVGTRGGILVALDGSSDWKPANSGMNASLVTDVAITGNDVVHAATPGGLFQSADGGASWRKASDVDEPLTTVATNGREVIYAGGEKGIKRSSNSGETWKLVTTGAVSGLAVTEESPETLYAAFSKDLLKSTDGGRTWSSVGSRLVYDDSGWFYYGISPSVIETDVENANTVYVAYEPSVARTDDGGQTWKNLLPKKHPDVFPAVAARGAIIHAAMTAGVITSLDRGNSWSAPRLTDERVQAIVIDPANPRRSYAGTKSGRVYRSDDSGNEWALFSNGLRGAAVHRLEISNSSGRIYAATAAGVFDYQIGPALGLERLAEDPLRLPRLVRQLSSRTGDRESSTGTTAFVLPAVGTVRGSRGAEFVTDVTLANDRAIAQAVIVMWLPQGNVNGPAVPAFRITLPPSDDAAGTLTIADLAGELRLDGLGALLVVATGPAGDVDGAADIDGFARVRTASQCGAGSVSQSLPAVSAQTFGARRGRGLGLRHDSDYRTNVGIVNLAEVTREFTVVVAGERHSERFPVSIPPFSPMQTPVPDRNYGAVALTVISDGQAPWVAYGSSVDNASGDSWASVARPLDDR